MRNKVQENRLAFQVSKVFGIFVSLLQLECCIDLLTKCHAECTAEPKENATVAFSCTCRPQTEKHFCANRELNSYVFKLSFLLILSSQYDIWYKHCLLSQEYLYSLHTCVAIVAEYLGESDIHTPEACWCLHIIRNELSLWTLLTQSDILVVLDKETPLSLREGNKDLGSAIRDNEEKHPLLCF